MVSEQSSEKSQPVTSGHTTTAMHHIVTKERVPGHEDYYEEGGLRTEGDGEDHVHEPPVCQSLDAAIRSKKFPDDFPKVNGYCRDGVALDRCVQLNCSYDLLCCLQRR